MSAIDYSSYSKVDEPMEAAHREAKRVDTKPAEKATKPSQAKPVVQSQPTVVVPSPQEQLTNEELEAKLETIGIDSTVIHKKFGKGTVVKINKNEKFIHVKFTLGEKKFVFPDAFLMGFLEVRKE